MSAELCVERLRKNFVPAKPAVDDVSFSVAGGEIVVLLGPSGCGKTTTLRCIAGLEHPTSGAIWVGGALLSAPENGVLVPPRRRNVGMVFQSYAVWPHMTVWQNVAYPLRHRGMNHAEIQRRVADALTLVELAAYADRSVVALSGGQMQRVALARSMVYEPQLLLLDEPLSNLDAQLRIRLRDDLRRIIKQAGLTALYVTHDQTEAVAIGDRIGVMREGRLLQLDTATAIYNRPADLFVASFTGASNVVPGRVIGRNGAFGTVEVRNGERLLASVPDRLGCGTEVHVALRPENVRFDANGAGENRFAASVAAQKYQGVQTIYELELLGTRIEALEVGTRVRHPVGSRVDIELPPSQCWAYPAGAG